MMSVKYTNRSMAVVLAILVGLGCEREDAASAPAPKSAAAPSNRIDIPPTVRRNLGMSFATAQRRHVDRTIRIPGSFELLPRARHEYRLALPGAVHLEVNQFDSVVPGDLLYRLRSPKWPEVQHEIIEAEQDIDSSRAAIDVARAALEAASRRIEILSDRLAVLSEAGVRNAGMEAEVATLEAGIPGLRAEIGRAETHLANARRTRRHALHRASAATGIAEQELVEPVEHDGTEMPAYRTIDWIDVRATQPGIIESLSVTDGGYAEPPSQVLSSVVPDQVRLRGMAMQSDLPRIGEAPQGTIVPPAHPGGADGGVQCDVTIGLEAEPAQRTVAVLATPLTHRSWMRPGVSAFLELVDESSGGAAVAIPRAAVVKDGMRHVFFRRDPQDPNRVIRVEADLGTDDGRWVVVNSGLAVGDEVVVDGAYELNLASQVDGMSRTGGHFHADGTWHAEEH